MKPFDFNIHLNIPESLKSEANRTLWGKESFGVNELIAAYDVSRKEFIDNVSNANFMLFNPDLPFGDHDIEKFISEVKEDFPNAIFTQLLDFRRNDVKKGLDRLQNAGIRGVKFHSYVQKIGDADIPKALAAAKKAAERGFFICIDASYGSTEMFEYNNMKLIAAIARDISEVPIIILHSGGAKRWEAMLIADQSKNVYLETSFSLPYYEGSSIESDFAFIYKKIGAERVLYASDYPAVGETESLACFERFIKKYNFSTREADQMKNNNADKLTRRV